MIIGDWVRRPRRKWHRVESVVADAAVTHCGRRLEPRLHGAALEVSPVKVLTRLIGQPQNCKQCDSDG